MTSARGRADAVVIGAGPNGLAAAAVLANAGRRVLVVERAVEIGGHTRAIEFTPGFRAPLSEDCGWIPPRVAKATGAGYETLRVDGADEWMSIVDGDGVLRTFSAVPARAAETLRSRSAGDAAAWPAFASRMASFASVLSRLYQLAPPDIETRSAREVLPLLGVARRLRGLGRAEMIEFLRVMPMPVQDLLDDTFADEGLKAAIAACAIRDLRQGPRSAGTTFNLLHYRVGGPNGACASRPWFVDGPDAFARRLAEIVRARDAEVRTGAAVARITVNDGAVSGVALASGEEIEAPIVISTADPRHTLLQLLDPLWLDPEFMHAVDNVKMRGCTAFVLYAMDALPSGTAAVALRRTVSLTHRPIALEQAADSAKYGEISAAPHVEVFAPTLRWPNLAPPGKHVLVARAQFAPYSLRIGTWDLAQKRGLENSVAAAVTRAFPTFPAAVSHACVLSPVDMEDRLGLTEGALTQGELTLDQILFMRPVPGWGRYRMPVDGLYLGGAGAHPGPGVLGGAGVLAAQTALR